MNAARLRLCLCFTYPFYTKYGAVGKEYVALSKRIAKAFLPFWLAASLLVFVKRPAGNMACTWHVAHGRLISSTSLYTHCFSYISHLACDATYILPPLGCSPLPVIRTACCICTAGLYSFAATLLIEPPIYLRGATAFAALLVRLSNNIFNPSPPPPPPAR